MSARRLEDRAVLVALACIALAGCGRIGMASMTDAEGPTAGPAATSQAPSYEDLRAELAQDPGVEVAAGRIGSRPWSLRLFVDRADSMDGEGPNLYVDANGPRYWLDRPDPGESFDSLWYAEENGADVLVVVVATADVARLVLRSGATEWEAEPIDPGDGAAFAAGFWVQATSLTAPFAGELIAYDGSGQVLQTRAFTTEADERPSEASTP